MRSSPESIRKPAVAGYFYPAGADTLARGIDGMIEAARPSDPGGLVRVLISPHAGYRYSGNVAAHGYRQLRGLNYHSVVVVSPSHVEQFDFSAVYDGDGYETPLGVVETSHDLVQRLASAHTSEVRRSARGHIQTALPRQEHALEVQIPFLQRSLGNFRLVAVVMGDQRWENCAALGKALASIADDPGVLIVASTDLSHFHDGATAGKLDSGFCAALSTLDARMVYDAVERGRCEACGAGPVIAALIATDRMPGRTYSELARANSGDVTGDYSGVVGYLSAAVCVAAA